MLKWTWYQMTWCLLLLSNIKIACTKVKKLDSLTSPNEWINVINKCNPKSIKYVIVIDVSLHCITLLYEAAVTATHKVVSQKCCFQVSIADKINPKRMDREISKDFSFSLKLRRQQMKSSRWNDFNVSYSAT